MRRKFVGYLVVGVCLLSLLSLGFKSLGKTNQFIGNQPVKHADAQVTGHTSKITKRTEIVKEVKYWCGDIERSLEPNTLWVGKEVTDLYDLFPPEDGWEVAIIKPDKIKVTKRDEDFCSKHRDYRHIGIYNDKVAIYQGPLGYQQTLLQQEDIIVSDLPSNLQRKLKAVMRFNECR